MFELFTHVPDLLEYSKFLQVLKCWHWVCCLHVARVAVEGRVGMCPAWRNLATETTDTHMCMHTHTDTLIHTCTSWHIQYREPHLHSHVSKVIAPCPPLWAVLLFSFNLPYLLVLFVSYSKWTVQILSCVNAVQKEIAAPAAAGLNHSVM